MLYTSDLDYKIFDDVYQNLLHLYALVTAYATYYTLWTVHTHDNVIGNWVLLMYGWDLFF